MIIIELHYNIHRFCALYFAAIFFSSFPCFDGVVITWPTRLASIEDRRCYACRRRNIVILNSNDKLKQNAICLILLLVFFSNSIV